VTSSSTITLLVADFAGSTRVFEAMPDDEAYLFLKEYLGRLRANIEASRGREVKSLGDGLMVAFDNAADGVACAVAMQRAIEEAHRDLESDRRLELRVGMNVGEAIRDESDYFGRPVIIAFRLSNAAEPGQILVSYLLREVVGSRGGFAFRALGQRALGGMREPMSVYEVDWRTGHGAQAAANPKAEVGPSAPISESRAEARPLPQITATILFLDVVDSTPLTAHLGDTAYRDKSRELDTILRGVIRGANGTPLAGKVLGDGVMAIFTAARQAVECALQCMAAAEPTGLLLHAGLHAGDVIRERDNVYGLAVNVAARIQAATAPGQILVSDIARGLARASTNVTFLDRGEHDLKGVSEPVRLYEVRAGD